MPGELTQAEAQARFALLDVESYEVLLDLRGPGAVRSHTEIRFRCARPGAATFANVTMPTVGRIVLNGQRLDPATAVSDGRLHLPGLAADNVLEVDAEFDRTRSGRGLSWFTDPADGATYVLGNCFPTHAPSVFCCFDQPDLRADFTLSVATPAGWDCVANGAVTGRPAAGEAGLWRFATVPGMKPYELALCAGPYVTVSDEPYDGAGGTVRLSLLCRPALAGSAGLVQAGRVVSRALGFYERFLGVPCPYGTYDVVFAPELGPLAVSLPGVMMVSEIMLRRMVVPGDDQVPLVLAHEVAHLWFGCLVEGRWWDDLWLAEALATYLSYLAGEEALGLGRPWAEFIMREQTGAYRADCLPSTQPVSSPVATAADAMNRPSAITYNKGASVIRQLAALIGGEALRAGLHDYLVTYGGAATTLDDIVGCWSRASGRDLGGWAQAWLRTAGVDTMRPELTVAPDGSIRSLTLARRPPATGTRPLPGLDALRTHRVAIGAYDRQGDGLSLRHRTEAEVSSADTLMPGLAGIPAPDAFVVNEGALTFARIRFDDRSFRALAACAMDIGDPLTEGVCWNAAWDMSTAAELSVGEFTDLVARRLDGEHPPPGVAELLGRAVTAADHYAPSAHRPRLRERIADAALAGVGRAEPGGRVQHALAIAFAASAHTGAQLGLLRSWLSGTSLPEGVESGLELRGEILATLSARGLATDADLGALAADDRVGGEAQAATCRARRPDPAAKRAAWTAAIADGQVPHLALAHARGIWVPGQEDILAPYRDRYFREALPAAGKHQPRWDARLAAALYPATLADAATIAATSAALDRGGLSGPLRAVLLEQRAVLEQVIAARALPRPA